MVYFSYPSTHVLILLNTPKIFSFYIKVHREVLNAIFFSKELILGYLCLNSLLWSKNSRHALKISYAKWHGTA